MKAKAIVDTLLEGNKMPYWKREPQQKHQAALVDIRARYGHDKAQPDERQKRLIRSYWRRGDMRKLTDYCRAHGLNPNSVIKDIGTE